MRLRSGLLNPLTKGSPYSSRLLPSPLAKPPRIAHIASSIHSADSPKLLSRRRFWRSQTLQPFQVFLQKKNNPGCALNVEKQPKDEMRCETTGRHESLDQQPR